ncbi:MAG: neutral/alkaline non-lysosomal ceramidase N-terminal domain-containing protein [Candidatus Latescibacteria bacterium]|nr:neutral/alkaline non-lysosomal ceramidase N-terminal domain-containing protein [Candidatus Latescibacterota bacterium]
MPSFLAGTARVDITPPAGLDMTGFIARLGPATGTHDPLWARAFVVEQDGTALALVAADILGFDRHSTAAIRRIVHRRVGRPIDVMLAATHTHSGPATLFLRHCGTVDAAWMKALHARVADAVCTAYSRLTGARVSIGSGEATIGINRRVAGGPTDPSVAVLRVETTDGRPLGAVVNYACHPVVLGSDSRLWSADFPAAANAALEQRYGAGYDGFLSLFINGAAGDINPRERDTFEVADRLGTELADAATGAWDRATAVEVTALRGASRTVTLPLSPPPSLDEAHDLLSEYGDKYETLKQEGGSEVAIKVAGAMASWAAELYKRLRDGTVPSSIDAEFQAFGLGPVRFIAVPGELFSAIGLAIKQACQGLNVFVVGYGNEDIGYLPTRQAFQQGGYEVADAHRYYDLLPVTPETENIVIEAAVGLINSL